MPQKLLGLLTYQNGIKGKVRKVEVTVDERVNVTFREAMI